MNDQPTARVARITVGRLYNLGNYEHVRYELTIDITEGASAASAIRGIERILAGLKPTKGGVKETYELQHDANRIERMKTMDPDDWDREYRHCVGTRTEIIARFEAQLAADQTKRVEALSRAKRARELFDDLNGAETWKDAKLEWDDDEYDHP